MTENSEMRPTTGSAAPVAFQQHDIDESIRAHSGMAAYDYADQFTIVTKAAASATPEEWARIALDEVAGTQGQVVWRVVLGLRLARRSAAGQVAGWPIVERGTTWITLGARSWLLSGRLVLEISDGTVSVGTFLRYESRLGGRVWAAVSPGHRRFAPELLNEATRILSARS
ncbi:hypothetical protein [Nocardia jinanensis]|uniref:DUF2867 domain-containing protein n=1 Tax=Nocardia jinanensis TaxID=382504 RepID=A0A917VXR4_9NOCA|nr:hypothetical protein [Nocardia jinanensis]GGL42504.1 hypothetical protein GCM10011588_66540 [Nocardia jinanensis]